MARLDLSAKLKTLCQNVYFNPPSSLLMSYPAIVYTRRDIDAKSADNEIHVVTEIYQLTIISHDPDEPLVNLVSRIPRTNYIRDYRAEGLNHTLFSITI